MFAVRRTALALIACAALSGAARAEAPSAPRLSLAPSAKLLDLTAPGLPVLYSRAPTPLPPGVARTSVEGKTGDAQLGAGLLCGLQPNADDSGAGRARGYDPDGKFVGAKLGFRF